MKKIDSKIKKERRRIKGPKTHERILQSAISCLASLGNERTTFQAIADHCGISQPLVVHYFKKRENVFPSVIEYLLQHTSDIIDTEIAPQESPVDRLRRFIRVSLMEVRKGTAAAKVLLILSFLAAFEERYRAPNAQVKQIVSNELIEILAAGIKSGDFEIKEITVTAKMITSYLMGARMSMLGEKIGFSDETIIQAMEENCLAIVGYKKAKGK